MAPWRLILLFLYEGIEASEQELDVSRMTLTLIAGLASQESIIITDDTAISEKNRGSSSRSFCTVKEKRSEKESECDASKHRSNEFLA